jgi:hypothetical protein
MYKPMNLALICTLRGNKKMIRLVFCTFSIFKDAAAQTLHGQSEAVRRFESIYSPELVGGEVIFIDYEMIAGKR